MIVLYILYNKQKNTDMDAWTYQIYSSCWTWYLIRVLFSIIIYLKNSWFLIG
jgi:hypothetical protein